MLQSCKVTKIKKTDLYQNIGCRSDQSSPLKAGWLNPKIGKDRKNTQQSEIGR
jgi:hypothetical protein